MNVLGLSETWMLCQPQYHHLLLASSSLRERNNTLVLPLSTILVCLIAQYEKKNIHCSIASSAFVGSSLFSFASSSSFVVISATTIWKKNLYRSHSNQSASQMVHPARKNEHNGPWTDSCSFLSSDLDARC